MSLAQGVLRLSGENIITLAKEGGLHRVIMYAASVDPEWQDSVLEIHDTAKGDCGQGMTLALIGVGSFFARRDQRLARCRQKVEL